MNDLLIRNATLVLEDTVTTGDVAIKDGIITALGHIGSETARETWDASGLSVLPGLIDAHVHFNEPGRDHWEGLSSGSRALAVGGGSAFFDMPLNSHPPVLDRESFDRKRALAEEKSVLDFALWGGLCPGHTHAIDAMAEAGAIGFKAFLCPSGIDEFPHTDEATLREGLTKAKRWNLPVAVHAESPSILDQAPPPPDRSFRSYLASRPKSAETESIRMACDVAGETGGRLHIVHVSCAEGVKIISEARSQGVDVTVETCPHYLLFDTESALQRGAAAKCSPPFRSPADREALWAQLLEGRFQTVGSDHSPAPPDMKAGDDFFSIWGGISGCQHAWPAFLGEFHRRSASTLNLAAALGSANVAERFRLPRKGALAVGRDADLAILSFAETAPVEAGDLLYRHPISLYTGYKPLARVCHVIRRGEALVRDGKIVTGSAQGRLLRPEQRQ